MKITAGVDVGSTYTKVVIAGPEGRDAEQRRDEDQVETDGLQFLAHG